MVAGHPAIVVEHVTRTRDDLRPDWARPVVRRRRPTASRSPASRSYVVDVVPSSEHGDHNHAAIVAACGRIVNAIPDVRGGRARHPHHPRPAAADRPRHLHGPGCPMIIDDFRVTDQVAIVTGAGMGIGRATAVALAEAGADVVVAARTRSDLDETVALVEATGRRGLAVVTDVMDDDQLAHLVSETTAAFGRLDILVNNAGGTGPRPAMSTSSRYFATALHFNATAPFVLSTLAARAMVDTGGTGAIVNISSRSADMVMTSFVAYGAAKAALNMMTQNLAADLAPRIRVNAIAVGGVATRALDSVMADEAMRRQYEENTPMRRAGQPRDVAAAVVYLASPASSWVTGVILRVDGGVTSPAISLPPPPLTPQ